MDPATFANTIMGILAPLMPFLGGVSAAIATNVGDTISDQVQEQAKRLYHAIKDRFAKDGSSSTQALQTFVSGDPDYSAVVKTKLERLLKEDPHFYDQLFQIIQSGPLQALILGEQARASDIDMLNSLGIGTQKIQLDKWAQTERVRFNITHPGNP